MTLKHGPWSHGRTRNPGVAPEVASFQGGHGKGNITMGACAKPSQRVGQAIGQTENKHVYSFIFQERLFLGNHRRLLVFIGIY